MAQAGIQLLKGIDVEAVVEALDRLRSSHLVSMHWAQTVRDRLEGPAIFLLGDELEAVAKESLEAASALGGRLARTVQGSAEHLPEGGRQGQAHRLLSRLRPRLAARRERTLRFPRPKTRPALDRGPLSRRPSDASG